MYSMWNAGIMPVIDNNPSNEKLARAYIPYQQYSKSYTPEMALERGTMFPELYDSYPVK